MKNKVSIITLTYNKLEEATKPFIDYLFSGGNEFELIIVDNGSTDGTVEFLQKLEGDNVKVIYNSENLGFSKGCNQGIEIAQGDIIGLLNNDILFSSDWIKYIVEVVEKEKNAGFVSPFCIEAFCNTRHSFEKLVKRLPKEISYSSCIKPSFSCTFAKKSVFDKIGLFDENFTPAYFEDDDIVWRALFNGFRNFELNNIYFYHLRSLTGNSLSDLHEIFARNKKYFFEKYSDKPFVECYWKENANNVRFRNSLLEKRLGLKLIGLKSLWKDLNYNGI